MYVGSMPGMKSGDVVGHEFMGIVESVGPQVKGIKPGEVINIFFSLFQNNFFRIGETDFSLSSPAILCFEISISHNKLDPFFDGSPQTCEPLKCRVK